ncbi:MAG: GNAT family N-acetyltransferase [Gammaproteobacteria bacterium]|nr:GNAT family N-acetyltransferase [Gammaproteobacteria bacterium]
MTSGLRRPTTIRPLREDDRSTWDGLWQGYLVFYEASVPAEVTATTWRRLLDAGSPLFGLGAIVDDRLVGFAHCVLHLGTWSEKPQCYLEDLFVDPAVRGGGVGRALIEAVYQAADRHGADRVYWLTHETNHVARALYDRIGQRSGFIHYTR